MAPLPRVRGRQPLRRRDLRPGPLQRRPIHPGEILREDFVPDYDLTVSGLAAALGVSRQSVNELLRKRRALSPEMALRLAQLFGNWRQSGGHAGFGKDDNAAPGGQPISSVFNLANSSSAHAATRPEIRVIWRPSGLKAICCRFRLQNLSVCCLFARWIATASR